jgi:chaperonin GroES
MIQGSCVLGVTVAVVYRSGRTGRGRKLSFRGGTTMKVRPLGDRLIVRRIEEDERTKGGLIIPDTAKEKPMEGEVIAVGKGKLLENGKVQPMEVKEEDKVLFGKYAGTEIKIDGEERLILREDDVLCVIEQGKQRQSAVQKGRKGR